MFERASASEAGIPLLPRFSRMSVRTAFKTKIQVVGNLAHQRLFPQAGEPLRRNRRFPEHDAEQIARDGTGRVAVAGNVYRRQHAGTEFPRMAKRAENPDGQRLFGDPAFAEFVNACRCPGLPQSGESFVCLV